MAKPPKQPPKKKRFTRLKWYGRGIVTGVALTAAAAATWHYKGGPAFRDWMARQWAPPAAQAVREYGNPSGKFDYRLANTGPSISVKTTGRILQGSPLAPYANFIDACGRKFHVDPVYALAHMKIESDFGRLGKGAKRFNPANVFGTAKFKGDVVDVHYLNRVDSALAERRWGRKLDDWERGIDLFFWQIAEGSPYFGMGRFTVEEIVPTYAPPVDEKGNPVNDTAAYMATLKKLVNDYRAMEKGP